MHDLDSLSNALSGYGLFLRGFFKPDALDIPGQQALADTSSLFLVGNGGSSLWPVFSNSPEFADGLADPLDRWSRRIGDELASRFKGLALYPFDGPPYLPFLRWTGKAEALKSSPLGLRLHPEFGLWHAYRFALLLPFELPEAKPTASIRDICLNCVDQPCLTACPVGAFTKTGYDVMACVEFLSNGVDAECNKSGCGSRHACPVGQQHAYLTQQAQFHMQAFKKAHQGY